MAKAKETEESGELAFHVKFVYGRHLYYPMNKLSEKLIEVFDKRKQCLTREQLILLKQLGVKINIIRLEEDDLL